VIGSKHPDDPNYRTQQDGKSTKAEKGAAKKVLEAEKNAKKKD
jgi:hypothetical protein